MNWEEYKVLAEKTLSTEFHCDKKEEILLHSVIGILTEVEELLDNHMGDKTFDRVNVVEECSDVAWYLSIIGREYNLSLPTQQESHNSDPMTLVLSIIKNTCKLLDMLKKKLYYNKPINESEFISITNQVLSSIMHYMSLFNINIEESFDINIEKLRARYGDKFSSDRAINRDLDNERNILEGK